MELTLGISPCPNDVWIFAGIILGEVQADDLTFAIDFQDVETLNHKAQAGSLDVAKISFANFIHCKDAYELLSSGGALGRGVGPLLLTNGTEFNSRDEILVPGEFTTANLLLSFYLQGSDKKRHIPFDDLYRELVARKGSQGVVIHENRFTYERDGLTLVQDLGQYWEEQTGYPVPLGGIVSRKSLGLAGRLTSLIRQSLEWAEAHPSRALALCRTHAMEMSDPVMQSHIDLYVNQYSHDLGPDGRAAVEFFLCQQAKMPPK